MSDTAKINLTLTPDSELNTPAASAAAAALLAEEKPKAEPVVLDESSLSEEERAMVREFSKKIDVTDSGLVLQYGAAAQKGMADFSESALERVKTKDLGEIGDQITELVVELKGFEVEEEDNFFLRMFKRAGNKLEALKSRYNKATVNVDKIAETLEGHQITLLKDVAVLDKMYEQNLVYFKELSMYIIAGKLRLEEIRNTTLKELNEKAKVSGLPEDAQAANDLANLCDRFEKKIHDLELTRMISVQTGPQIRLVQNNDTLMVEKIQTTLVNTIPLWKNQMVLALGMEHSRQAMEAQRAVTDMTNELLKKNADALKMGTIETAKEAERGIVDMETLRYTNESLISTLDEVLRISDEGKQKRRAAEQELGRIEGELKQKMLEISTRSQNKQ